MPLTNAQRSAAFRERHGDARREYIRNWHRNHNEVLSARRRLQKHEYYLTTKGALTWACEAAKFRRMMYVGASQIGRKSVVV